MPEYCKQYLALIPTQIRYLSVIKFFCRAPSALTYSQKNQKTAGWPLYDAARLHRGDIGQPEAGQRSRGTWERASLLASTPLERL